MQKSFILIVFVLFTLACQTTQTIADMFLVTVTPTARPTNTLVAIPSLTPRSLFTLTPNPTVPVTPAFIAQTKKTGALRDTSRAQEYTMQITVKNVWFDSSAGYSKPKAGFVFASVSLSVQNLGPGTAYSVYSTNFQIRDSDGALRGSSILASSRDCSFDLVDLASSGKVDGCIGFEVPVSGKLEFIYAPYKYEGLQPGRYLSFVIRP